MFIFSAAVLGLILGSFLNALLFRFNTGKSVLRGRSRCMHCGHMLAAVDLVPVFSYIYLRAACSYCRSRISWQYPIVEASAAALSVLVYLQNPEPLHYVLGLAVRMTLLFIVVYDLRHQIIPWSASGLLAVLGLGHVWILGFDIWTLAAGPILAAPLLLISLVSRGRGVGGGDGAPPPGLGGRLGVTE